MFKDGSMSENQTISNFSDFEKSNFDQIATPVHIIKINHKNKTSSHPGLMMGIELYDSSMSLIIKAGCWNPDIFSKVTEILL